MLICLRRLYVNPNPELCLPLTPILTIQLSLS